MSRYFPTWTPVASQHSGLSGGSSLISDGQQTLVLRQRHQAAASPFLRQYRLLRRLPAALAPRPRLFTGEWMAIEYLPGEVCSALPPLDRLVPLLHDLHSQPLFGWRIALLPLLETYWQQSAPSRRTPCWLRYLKRLHQQKEPVPLRLSPLHMDIHGGNLVQSSSGLRLIDWEYAGDGDVALELAAIWMDNEAHRRELVIHYAQHGRLDAVLLWRQVKRWRPWVQMLMAGWYECRWQQTGDQQFITLADAIWRQLSIKG